MPERDYTSDWDAWLTDNPYEWQGKPEPPQNQPGSPWMPAPTTPLTTAPPPVVGGGSTRNPNAGPPGSQTPNMDPPGYRGGYWGDDGNWVQGSPSNVGPNIDNTQANPLTSGAGASFDGAGFNWSQFNPEKFSFGPYVSKFGAYASPTPEEAEQEPGYAFGRDQGRKVLENSRAGAGVLRTGGTLKDILEYGNQFATQNYAGVDQRKHRNWQSNTDQDLRSYTTNRDTAYGVYDRNYRGDLDSFNAKRRGEELDFSDAYNRWKSRLESLTSIATNDPG